MIINNVMYHIGLNAEIIENTGNAILTGDPGRVDKIAGYLNNPKFIHINREYTSYLGYINSKPLLVMSTGIGGPSSAIAVEELAKIGIKNIIRVGTCGGMQKNIQAGDLIIANAAVRAEGTSLEYMPIEYPAVADFEITSTLKKSAENLNIRYHIGIVHCKDSFYAQHDPDSMPVSDILKSKWNAYIKGGVLASEMETAAIFTASAVRKIHSGAVLLCIWNQELKYNKTDFDMDLAIKTAINAYNLILA